MMVNQNNLMSTEMHQRLNNLRRALLRLHKSLLEIERVNYERVHGRVTSSGELLQLVISHEQFAWLHALSEFIVRIDELFDAKDQQEKNREQEATELLQQARLLLTPAEEGTGFARKYHQGLQHHPEIVIAHREISKLLSA